jgi:hypothetical protein
VPRRELLLLTLFGGCWIGSMAHGAAGFPFAGALPLDLYVLDGLAAAAGWLCGNLYVNRRRATGRRGALLLVYLVGPTGPLYLLFTLASSQIRQLAPLAPLWAFAIFALFFLVPVSFRRPARR